MDDPETSDDEKADNIRDKIRDLAEEVGYQFRIRDSGNLGSFEVKDKQRQRKRIHAVAERIEPLERVCPFQNATHGLDGQYWAKAG